MRLLSSRVEAALREVLECADPWDDLKTRALGPLVRCPHCHGTGTTAEQVVHDESDGECAQRVAYEYLWRNQR